MILGQVAVGKAGAVPPRSPFRASAVPALNRRESPEWTLSQRTLEGLADAGGVTSVLVGMRRPEYVRDAVGTFGG